MIDTLMGVAWGLYGHIATHELLLGIIDIMTLGCKAQLADLAATREDR